MKKIIEKYETQMNTLKESINKKQEDIIELTKKLKGIEMKKKEPFFIEYVEKREIIGIEKPKNFIKERDSFVKIPLETEKVYELFIRKIYKPENSIQKIEK